MFVPLSYSLFDYFFTVIYKIYSLGDDMVKPIGGIFINPPLHIALKFCTELKIAIKD